MEIVETNAPPGEPAATTAPEPMAVGDRVRYVPGEAHARQQNKHAGPHGEAGDFPWMVGRSKPVIVRGQKTGEQVVEITGSELRNLMAESKKNQAALANVVFVRPKSAWPAKVRAVNHDGTVDIDAASNQAGIRHNPDGTEDWGVTLHYSNVPVTDGAGGPHTCHKGGDK